ncbi:MAG: glycosyltransferase family 4 protein, partial [Parvularculaceae bacterium]|nr:glycosyltransferase family 4 protein [Parvularculaceae bacterium]
RRCKDHGSIPQLASGQLDTLAMRIQAQKITPPRRVFYAAGPGDAIKAHANWKAGAHDPSEVAVTFSGQIAQYCKDVGAALYTVSYHKRKDMLVDGDDVIEHLPRVEPSGVRYAVANMSYGLQLLQRARRFGADAAILDSGCTYYFFQSLFAASGMRVVPVLHNALWPNGFRRRGVAARAIEFLDGFFWRHTPVASLCVSPLCARQVTEVAGPRARPLVQVRAQFDPSFFAAIPPPPPEEKPFRIMFIGRVVAAKGVFDIVDMASKIEAKAPGRVRWTLCGAGADFDAVKAKRDAAGLADIVAMPGWTSLEDLARVYADSHAAIVPTRSDFIEGLAMTAAEAALAGRPVVTNPVVPALEVLGPAAVACRTNDVDSYVEAILSLIDDPQRYRRLAASCREVAAPFLDRRMGLTEVLKDVLGGR